MENLPPEALQQVAAFFQALSEPMRLQLLNRLRERPSKVGELALACGCSTANASRHLSLLAQHGLVARESRGTSAYYRIADPAVYQLCDLVCGQIAQRWAQQSQRRTLFALPAPAAPHPGDRALGEAERERAGLHSA